MTNAAARIDPVLFERHFAAFKNFVREESGMEFTSFAANPYTDEQEGYKDAINRDGRRALSFQDWNASDVGSGKIIEKVIRAIELPENNLVPWQGRWGKDARPHHSLFEALDQSGPRHKFEACFFQLFREERNEQSFDELIACLGRKYPLLAYFFFLKDHSRFLPIAPETMDGAFAILGANFKTSGKCSWENYITYVILIGQIREHLGAAMLPGQAQGPAGDVTLLNAHSFAWMLASQMFKRNKLGDVEDYTSLPPTEREAVIMARVGQGKFRESLIRYWADTCAVTDCAQVSLLRASHIKPWSESEAHEQLGLYNGLLLSPHLDACFDQGYIGFDNDGRILISERLSEGMRRRSEFTPACA